MKWIHSFGVLTLGLIAILCWVLLLSPDSTHSPYSDQKSARAATIMPAFPGAEGFGAESIGGRGGAVCKVTNLNNSGAGSLRNCAQVISGARTVIFEVGGTIDLLTDITISNPYITIAGQTAPGDGIALKNGKIVISTHDVILRYFRIRPGGGVSDPTSGDALQIGVNVYNLMIDHMSLSWATDEVVGYYGEGTTIQWTMFTEPLNCSTHTEGCHSKSILIRPGSAELSLHHNFFAHSNDRNPQIQDGSVEWINNIIYNINVKGIVDMEQVGYSVLWDAIGNYYKDGPDSVSRKDMALGDNSVGSNMTIHVSGNISPNRTSNSDPETDVLEANTISKYTATKLLSPTIPITASSAFVAYQQVLDGVGATLPVRDSTDARVVNTVRYGTGSIIDDPSEVVSDDTDVEGWSTLSSSTAPSDTDNDGMPDTWEEQYGFDPDTASDGILDTDSDGYTNLEEYLNSTIPAVVSPFSQTNWIGGANQFAFDNVTQFRSLSNTIASVSGELKLSRLEKLINTTFETSVSDWETSVEYTGTGPDAIANITAWYKADSLSLSDGDLVSAWSDSSISGNDIAQGTSTKQPTYHTSVVNAQPALTADGSDTLPLESEISLTGDFTITWVANYEDIGSADLGTIIGDNSDLFLYPRAVTGTTSDDFFYFQRVNGSTVSLGLNGAFPLDSFNIWTFKRIGSTYYLYKNGAIATDNASYAGDSGTVTLRRILSRRDTIAFFTGELAEFLVYSDDLSDTDRNTLETYLGSKYGISVPEAPAVIRSTTASYNYSAASAKAVTFSYPITITQSVNVTDTQKFFLETYAYTSGAAVTSSDAVLYANGSEVSTTFTNVGDGWYKLSGEITGANESRDYGLKVKANKTVYFDDITLSRYFDSGSLTSSILDTGQTSAWGTLTYVATTPEGSNATVKVRSGNDATLSDAITFSGCTAIASGQDVSSNSCIIDGHRYIQYEITLTPSTNLATPTFESFELSYSLGSPIVSSSGSSSSVETLNTVSFSNTVCGATAPISAPNLFQINTTQNTATLYFSPITTNNEKYYVSYSTSTNAELHGAEVSLGNTGVQKYEIELLSPNTAYYFKVRGANGCAPGPWSGILPAKTRAAFNSNTGVVSQLSPTPEELIPTPGPARAIPKLETADEDVPVQPIAKVFPKTYDVSVFLHKDGKPIAGIPVELHSDPRFGTTNAEGKVLLTDVAPGQHTLKLAYEGTRVEEKITVSGESPVFDVSLNVTVVSKTPSWMILGGVVMGVAILILIVLLLINIKK